MKKGDLYTTETGHIFRVKKIYPKPCVLVEVLGEKDEIIVFDTIENFEKYKLKKIN